MSNGLDAVERMTIVRVLHAPRAVVWQAWTDPQQVRRWWGPQGFTAPVCQMDFRVGGRFLLCMRAPDGQEFWNGGEYHEIVPQEKIVSSLYFADPQGNRVESEHYGMGHEVMDEADDITLLEDLGDGRTRLTLIGNESMESARNSGQVEGWEQILDKVAAVVAELTRVEG